MTSATPDTHGKHGNSSSSLGVPPRFSITVQRHSNGEELRSLLVPAAFVRDFQHELWMRYALRRGQPAATLADMTIAMEPLRAEGQGSAALRGVRVEVVNPRKEAFEIEYNVQLFSEVASRVVAELMTEGVLKATESYAYELRAAEELPEELTGNEVGSISFGKGPTTPALTYLSRAIAPLLADSESVNDPDPDHMPVFYTADAYARAERFARHGAAGQPPRETGAALIGTLCSCPKSGEFYAVVTDALEATDAEEEKVSLAYTGKTWLRLQAVLKSIQGQSATSTYRLLGQAHGHNFVPLDGAPPCEICDTTEVCSRTSVFVSIDDRTWTQAVFAGAPFALCHIFGLNARHEEVHGLYSLRDNRLTQRGFYLLPEFDPTAND